MTSRDQPITAVIQLLFNPFKPEFTIVIVIHYKPRIAVAIFDLYFFLVDEDDLMWVKN